MSTSRTTWFDGVRVLDLSQFIPGPYATLLLSDLGADVVKIEPPAGDPQRCDGPIGDDGISNWYHVVNRNKRVVLLDLKRVDGKRMFERLLGVADVLLESFRPGVLARLGFSRERIATINPRLIHCALTGYGQTGPDRLRAGHDINYQALAGLLDISGTAAAPVAANPPIADFAGAQMAIGLICAALFARTRNDRGTFIDIAMTDAAVALAGTDLAALDYADFDTGRGIGPYAGGWACYNTYRTSCGGHVTLGALEPRFWANFCTLAGRPDWIGRQHEPRPQEELIAEVAALMATRNLAEWTGLFDGTETCFQDAVALSDLAGHPQIAQRRILHRGADRLVDALMPAWIDCAPPPDRRPLAMIDADAIGGIWNTTRPDTAPGGPAGRK